MTILPGCTIRRTTLERLEVVGPMDQADAAMTRLHADGYRVIRSGPYTDRAMHPKVDTTRFLYIAEREVP